MRQTLRLFLCAIGFLLPALGALADRGMIPFDPSVKLFEPNQRAMIAWNGAEQILLLTTTVKASSPTRVLEVLPLPAEPTVTKGSVETFHRAVRVINKHQKMHGAKRNGGSKGVEQTAPAGRITFHARIGAHDVAVTQVVSADGFVGWVEKALKSAGVKEPRVPDWTKTAVQRYIDEGYAWFVFDSIEVGPTPKTIEPLRYRFAATQLFYPLRITKVAGPTTVDVIVLTPRLLSSFPALPAKRVDLPHPPFPLNDGELRYIDEQMATMLKNTPGTMLRIWKITDGGQGFTQDLIAY